jgi:hypothetical protein
MKSIKLQLFEFRNKLTVDQLDESRIAQIHLQNFDQMSEKEAVWSLTENLRQYSFDPSVKIFLESVNDEIKNNSLIYELKDLYKRVERQNLGVLYRQPLVTLLNIINKANDDARMEAILNELSIYDYVPEIKRFLLEMTTNPIERQNLKNSGKAEKIYTIVEKIDDGHLAYVGDRWFIIAENEIKQVLAEDFIKDPDKVRQIRLLEQVMNTCDIIEERITFKLDENLMFGISTKNKSLYINDEKLNEETTLETIFKSTIVPILKRDYYLLAEAVINNIDKFVDLDIAMKITNILNPYMEATIFNYKDKMYAYSRDTRYGSRFYMYENATELIHDIRQDLDYDLTPFLENKLSKELKELRTLEDREQQIELKLKDINESIAILKDSELLTEDENIEKTYNNFIAYKAKMLKELNDVKEEKIKSHKSIVNNTVKQ